MKYLVLSDIHGSSYCFEKALEVFDKFSCDEILILGDILYHGPRNDLPYGHNVKKLIQLLNERKDIIKAIKGNCDAEVDQMVLDFKIEDNLLLNINNKDYFLTHGHHINPAKPIKLKSKSVVLYGHSHIPNFEIIDEIYYFNPGSISIPKNGSLNSLAIIENDKIIHLDINGNIIKIYEVK